MIVIFEKDYLKELYFDGKAHSKQYRFQPDIVSRYVKVINMMINANNITDLMRFGSLHYEHLTGDKKGISSVRVNDKYRVEFIEKNEGEQKIATICNILELTNHYK
ncbi:MAG: type II toxin-antitoxin system RelE/ParE family toxin [bacterium]|nr:type II toxin-antitoxin system RelE/ParE family toxin [Candidatus Limimorpha caballi]